jgi:hypothetical protein
MLLGIRCVAPFVNISLFGFSRSIPAKLNGIVPPYNIAVMVSEASRSVPKRTIRLIWLF